MHLSLYLQQSPRGEAARLARAINAPRSHISMWAKGVRPCPVAKCVALERETFGRVHRCDMRSDWRDYWPDLIPLRAGLVRLGVVSSEVAA